MPGIDLTVVAQRYLDHALAGRDSEAVRTVLGPLVTHRFDLTELYEGILAPVAEQVGELWHRSEITVADEHFVTQLNQRVIAVAVTLTTPRSERTDDVVLACPPDELHDTALRMLSHLLSSVGYRTHLLGASTPIRDLVEYVQRVEPKAVGLSIASSLSLPGLDRAAAALQDAVPGIRILVGGRGRVEHRDEVLGVDPVPAQQLLAPARVVDEDRCLVDGERGDERAHVEAGIGLAVLAAARIQLRGVGRDGLVREFDGAARDRVDLLVERLRPVVHCRTS